MKRLASVALAVLVAGCGGGGGSSSSTAPAALNLNAAYKTLLQGGNSVLYTLSGDCTGYSSQTALPAYDFKNWATPAVAVSAVDNVQFDTLSTESQASAVCAKIFNSNNNEVDRVFYSPSDQTIVNSGSTSSYWKIYSGQNALPTSVSAGSTGTLYTWKDYEGASSMAGNPAYTGTVTYSVAADTATTLLVTITDAATETASGKPAWTVATTYRLNANNTLTSISLSLKATENSPLKAAGSVVGTATAAITLNAQAAKVATMTAGATNRYKLFDGNGNQCSPNAVITTSALSSTSGTTQQGTSYAKSSTDTFSPSTFTGSGNCSNFNLPASESAYFDANYALVQQTTNNSNNVSYNITASTQPLPTAATINSKGQQYTFKRYSSTSPSAPIATGNSIYYVGAITPNKLAFFDVETKNYTNPNDYPARQIFVYTAETNNGTTPLYGYVNDSSTVYLIPSN